MLREVFEECKRVLEPGGRIAVNVANLGRRPYRSLAGDVSAMLQDLGLLLRGEVVWWKGRAAGGSCAWGSFQRSANRVLHDVTERIVIASKGRFDRALKPSQRLSSGLPSTATISRDEFTEATTDLWEIAPGGRHPGRPPRAVSGGSSGAPDPALHLRGRRGARSVHELGIHGRGRRAYESPLRRISRPMVPTSDRANERISEECDRRDGPGTSPANGLVRLPAGGADEIPDHQVRAVREGRQAKELARIVLGECGFADIRSDVKVSGSGVELSFLARDQVGDEWCFDVSGGFTTTRTGLRRAETLWQSLGRAAALHRCRPDLALVLLTTDAPVRGSPGACALGVLRGPGRPVFDVVELLDRQAQGRLESHCRRGGGDGSGTPS